MRNRRRRRRGGAVRAAEGTAGRAGRLTRRRSSISCLPAGRLGRCLRGHGSGSRSRRLCPTTLRRARAGRAISTLARHRRRHLPRRAALLLLNRPRAPPELRIRCRLSRKQGYEDLIEPIRRRELLCQFRWDPSSRETRAAGAVRAAQIVVRFDPARFVLFHRLGRGGERSAEHRRE